MRKYLVVAVVPLFLTSMGVAANGSHPMAGCGLGYLLLSNDKNDKVTQVLGATTNGTFGSQTFGISSGTSGCTEDGAVKVAKATEVYADVNLDSLRRDMAMGQGEYVNTFATLLGASEAQRPLLVKFFQDHYAALFPTADTTTADMLATLTVKLAEHPELLG